MPETPVPPEAVTAAPAEVVTAWARSLTTWERDRVESDFTDPATGQRFTFLITRRPESPAAEEKERTLIRARGEAYRRLAAAHGSDYQAILADVLAELGAPVPAVRRQ